jgi:hypothetical protein
MRRTALCLAIISSMGALALVPVTHAQDLEKRQPMVGMTASSNSETSLAVSPTLVDHGTPVTFSADVQPTQGGPEPTGTVGFYLGGYLLGTAPVKNTVASITFPTRNVPTGTYGIYAKYSGDSNYKGSQSDKQYFGVNCQSNSTSDMAASPSWIYPGTVITLATDVSQNQGGPNPTGTVLFFEGPNAEYYLGSAPIINNVATLNVNTKGASHGAYQFTSYYTGDKIYLPSTSETDWVWVQ